MSLTWIIKTRIMNDKSKKYLLKNIIWETSRRNRLLLIFSVSALVLGIILTLPQPLITKYLIDNVIIRGGNPKELIFIVVILVIVAIFKTIFSAITDYLFTLLNQKMIFELEIKLFRHVQYAVPLSHDWKKGYIQSRIKNDIASLGSIFVPSLVNASKEILTLIVGVVFIFYLSPILALASLVLYPIFIFAMISYNKKMRIITTKYYEARSHALGVLTECINLIQVFKNMTRDSKNILSYFKSSKKAFHINLQSLRLTIENSSFLGFILLLIPIIVFTFGGYLVIIGNLTIGTLVAFSSYLAYVYRPTSILVGFNTGMQQALSAWERIHEVLDLPQESYSGTKIIEIKSIALCECHYSRNTSTPILANCSIAVAQGQTIGITGKSGVGKSTLLSLLLGEIKPSKGKVLVNGINLSSINPFVFRERVGVISQEPIVFNDSIFQNILIGNRFASPQDVYQAAQQAHINEYIDNLENGYLTIIREDGKNISIGQKQRIAIARSLICDPDVLIMDEPTSSIDSESEAEIIKAIAEIKKTKIIIIVTHREEILSICDRVFELCEQNLSPVESKV